jgi:polar amino acid transport system substrate-binding protein
LCINILKATSIVGYIAIQDLTRAGDLIRSRTFDALVPLLVVTVLYFLLVWLLAALFNLATKKKKVL